MINHQGTKSTKESTKAPGAPDNNTGGKAAARSAYHPLGSLVCLGVLVFPLAAWARGIR